MNKKGEGWEEERKKFLVEEIFGRTKGHWISHWTGFSITIFTSTFYFYFYASLYLLLFPLNVNPSLL